MNSRLCSGKGTNMDEHYYTSHPTSEIKEREYIQTINTVSLKFRTVSGVFSFGDKVDKASELLIKHFMPTFSSTEAYAAETKLLSSEDEKQAHERETSVLDLGCGYGAIGLFIKAMHPELKVTLIDVNDRAVEYARENAKINNLAVEAFQSDLYSALGDRTFDFIVTNPPIAAGKKLNTQLIEQALMHLKPGGSLWLVAFHNKGGATLKSIMQNNFGNAKDIEKSGGIRVYKSVRN